MKKTRMRAGIFIFIIVLMLSSFGFAENQGDVYVIPVNGEINKGTYGFLNESMDKAYNEGAKGIIFEIDTYGGLVDEAERIKNLIVSSPIPTISFVNNKAESAGVLLTIASEKVVMSESATIGSAETIPNTEKVLSMWRGFLRDTAQLRDRNSEIIEGMADSDIEIEGLTEKGKLINLTSNEAKEYGIADLVTNDYNEILKEFDLEDSNIVNVEETIQMKISKYISSPYVSSLLLSIGFVGLVVEILTPGFGLGGTLSVIGFGLYFGGNILAGNSQWISLALFVTGLILLVIEIIAPGFGLPGISGIVLVLIGTALAMESIPMAIISLSIAIIITSVITMILLKLGYRADIFERAVLETSHDDKKQLSKDSNDKYIDKEGVTLTGLRPSGFIEIDGVKLDALSDEGLIPSDLSIKVVRVEGSKIFVRRV